MTRGIKSLASGPLVPDIPMFSTHLRRNHETSFVANIFKQEY